MIEVPSVKNLTKQVTINNRINTDRCFLLIEKLISMSNPAVPTVCPVPTGLLAAAAREMHSFA